jgi:hypothetical protein
MDSEEFIGIRTEENPPSLTRKAYLWGSSPHYGIFTKTLQQAKIPLEWLKNEPGKNCKGCVAEKRDKVEVNTDGPGHFMRHMGIHLPDGIGFFTYCPACGERFRGGDSFVRHALICSTALTRSINPKRLQDDGKRNVFLR